MLTFTPDIEAAMAWFDATHRLAIEDGRAQWIRTAFPRAGGAGEQDARLMAALEHLRLLHNTLTSEAVGRQRNQVALDQWRKRRQESLKQ